MRSLNEGRGAASPCLYDICLLDERLNSRTRISFVSIGIDRCANYETDSGTDGCGNGSAEGEAHRGSEDQANTSINVLALVLVSRLFIQLLLRHGRPLSEITGVCLYCIRTNLSTDQTSRQFDPDLVTRRINNLGAG